MFESALYALYVEKGDGGEELGLDWFGREVSWRFGMAVSGL